MKLQHFAEPGGDGDKTLAQGGGGRLGNARIEALGFTAVKHGQFLDLGIVGLERGGAAVFQFGNIAFQGHNQAFGHGDQAFDARGIFHFGNTHFAAPS